MHNIIEVFKLKIRIKVYSFLIFLLEKIIFVTLKIRFRFINYLASILYLQVPT